MLRQIYGHKKSGGRNLPSLTSLREFFDVFCLFRVFCESFTPILREFERVLRVIYISAPSKSNVCSAIDLYL